MAVHERKRCVHKMTLAPTGQERRELVLIQKNGDCKVEASFSENEVGSSNVTGLTYCNVEWKQQLDKRGK
jgi:hypothetical protein